MPAMAWGFKSPSSHHNPFQQSFYSCRKQPLAGCVKKANFEVRKANPSFPRFLRHSRESGNPGAAEGRYSGVSPLHPAWIPAVAGVSVLEVKGLSLSGSWVKRRHPGGTALCNGMEQQQQLAHDRHQGHLAGFAAAPQTTIEALQFLVEPYG